MERTIKGSRFLLVILGCGIQALAQQVVPIRGVPGGRDNAAHADHRHSPSGGVGVGRVAADSRFHKDAVVFIGDTVIPQVVDGSTWQTSFIIRNLESTSKHCQLLFFADDGSDLDLPLVGLGASRGVDLTINSGGTMFFQTTGDSTALLQGWALLVEDNPNDSIGGVAVFRQRVPGRPDSEAVVPVVSRLDGHFVLIFDNTNGFVTGMAIANPTGNSVMATASILDEFGKPIDQQTLSLSAYSHLAFSIPDTWASTAGHRGSIEFQTSGYGIGVLGLRFNPFGSFTSFDTLTNFNWVVSGS